MTIDPVLMCAACGAVTLHLFVERQPHPRRPGELPYVDCVYECDACGEQRRWGNEPREETAYGLRLAADALAHAVDKHGMRRERCPACGGMSADCSTCGDDGKAWVFDRPEPCGRRCPLAGLDPSERE